MIVDLLQDAVRQVGRAVSAELAVVDLTLDQWRVLRALEADAGRTMGEVAEAAQLTAATATRAVDTLVDRGLAYRHAPASDRRQVVVVLAAAGGKLVARLDGVVREAERRALQTLGIESPRVLRDLLMPVHERIGTGSQP
jgi:DNA-binding MarR family transcriptional regulator